MAKDNVIIGNSIKLQEQMFGEIVTLDHNILLKGHTSGVVGLAFPSTSVYNITIFDSLIQKKILLKNIIAFDYTDIGGEISFGEFNRKAFKGNLNQHKVIEKYFWTLSLNQVKIGSIELSSCDNNCKVSIDTGTSSIIVPNEHYPQIISMIKVEKDCSNLSYLPSISFKIDEIEYVLTADDYVYKYFNTKTIKVNCALNIIPMDITYPKGPYWVFGENFIKRYYTIFDRDTDSIYLGLKN